MAANTAHLIETYSRMAKAHILPRLNAIGLTNRSYEGDARNSSKVYITTDSRPMSGGAASKATNIGRTGDWPTALDIGTEQDELPIDQDPAHAVRLDWLDAYDVPLPMVQRAAYWNARTLAEYVDHDIYSVMLDGVAAGNKATIGTAGNYIAPDGSSTGTTTGFVADALRDMQTALQVANLLDTGIAQYRWRADMSPALFRNLQDWLLDQDQQISRSWRDEIVRTSGLANQNYRYSIFDFDIYVTTQIPTADVGGNAHAQILISNPMATTLAMAMPLQQIFTPQENQVDSKAGWLFRERMHYGRKVIDDRFIFSRQVRAVA